MLEDEEYVVMPVDYEVPAYYKSRELVPFSFSKKDKQAHELVIKILLRKTESTCSCSKFERVFIYVVIEGMKINCPMAIFHRFFKVSRHMVYGHLIMVICRAYGLDLEGV